MPEIPAASVLSYLGVVALIFSVFLILAGLNVLQIEKISVAPGRRTWGIGVFLALAGAAFLWLDNRSVEQPGPPTPAPTTVAMSTTAPAPTLVEIVETDTPLPPSGTPAPITPTIAEGQVQGPTEAPPVIPSDTSVPTTAVPVAPEPTASDTPTATVPPLSPAPEPQGERLIEDFESYGSDASLAERFEINKNAGNDGWIRLAGVPHVLQGMQAMAFEFDIRHDSPNNYIGLNRVFPAQDWSGYSSLCMWIESDGSNRGLVVQFGQSVSGFWKEILSLSQGTGDYCISLREQNFINLRTVGYYGVYVQGPPQGRSVIYIDNVRVVE